VFFRIDLSSAKMDIDAKKLKFSVSKSK